MTSITFWCFRASRARFCSWYWYFPKSMIRQTGGTAVGEISTRSSPFCLAIASACGGGMMPSCCAGVVDDPDFADADAFVDPHAIVAAGTSVESDNGLLTIELDYWRELERRRPSCAISSRAVATNASTAARP